MALNGAQGRLAAVERLVRERVSVCLPEKTGQSRNIQVTLFGPEGATATETDGYGLVGPRLTADRRLTRERHNRLRYESTVFEDDRGLRIGQPVDAHTRLWNRVLAREDGRRLWEIDSKLEGHLVQIMEEDDEADAERYLHGATHAVGWWRPSPEGRTEAVHVLDREDVAELAKRVTGWLIEKAIAFETGRGMLSERHPLRQLTVEHQARREANR